MLLTTTRDDGGKDDAEKPPLYHPKHFFGHHRLILIQSQLPLGPPLHLIRKQTGFLSFERKGLILLLRCFAVL